MKRTPQHSLARCAVAAITGVIFALGLGLAGMTQPGKVLGFLDVTGDWDPSLACVMGGAALTFGICYRLIIKRPAPIFDMEFKIPQGKKSTGSWWGARPCLAWAGDWVAFAQDRAWSAWPRAGRAP